MGGLVSGVAPFFVVDETFMRKKKHHKGRKINPSPVTLVVRSSNPPLLSSTRPTNETKKKEKHNKLEYP